MAIWTLLEQRYLPPYRPSFVPAHIPDCGVEAFLGYKPSRTSAMPKGPNYDDFSAQREIWNLADSEAVPLPERIVLSTTFDHMVVRIEEIDQVIKAFRSFGGETSLGEQADILERIKREGVYIAVAWNQTSVCSSPWFIENEETEEVVPYNLNLGTKHHFLFDELEVPV